MQVTMSTKNHEAYDAIFRASRSDLPIAIGSASFVILVTPVFTFQSCYCNLPGSPQAVGDDVAHAAPGNRCIDTHRAYQAR